VALLHRDLRHHDAYWYHHGVAEAKTRWQVEAAGQHEKLMPSNRSDTYIYSLLSDADNLSLQVALCSFALDLAPSADCWRYRGRLVIRLSGKEIHLVDEMERSSNGRSDLERSQELSVELQSTCP
jgi:hypothetical protein